LVVVEELVVDKAATDPIRSALLILMVMIGVKVGSKPTVAHLQMCGGIQEEISNRSGGWDCLWIHRFRGRTVMEAEAGPETGTMG
jgi:hypothetical protein